MARRNSAEMRRVEGPNSAEGAPCKVAHLQLISRAPTPASCGVVVGPSSGDSCCEPRRPRRPTAHRRHLAGAGAVAARRVLAEQLGAATLGWRGGEGLIAPRHQTSRQTNSRDTGTQAHRRGCKATFDRVRSCPARLRPRPLAPPLNAGCDSRRRDLPATAGCTAQHS